MRTPAIQEMMGSQDNVEVTDFGGGQQLRRQTPRRLLDRDRTPADPVDRDGKIGNSSGGRQSGPLCGHHSKEGACRAHLPRLPSQRSYVDGGSAAVAARVGRCSRFDALDVAPDEERPRSQEIHRPHGTGHDCREQRMERLLRL
jgi:hypothetical protein